MYSSFKFHTLGGQLWLVTILKNTGPVKPNIPAGPCREQSSGCLYRCNSTSWNRNPGLAGTAAQKAVYYTCLADIFKQKSKQEGLQLTRIFCSCWLENSAFDGEFWMHKTIQASSWRQNIRHIFSWRGLYSIFNLIENFWQKKSAAVSLLSTNAAIFH